MLYLGKSRRRITPCGAGCCGQGAVGRVHEIAERDDVLYKEISPSSRTDARRRKLEKLIEVGANIPSSSLLRQGVAWPIDLVTNEDGEFTGFILPKVQDGRTLEDLSSDATVSSTMRLKLGLQWGRIEDALLRIGIVVGDLSLRNALYDPEAMRMVIIDPDSFQVEVSSGVICGVAESLELSYEMLERGRNHPLSWRSDAFLYAIALHRLLFQAHPLDDAEEMFERAGAIARNIEARRYPYLRAPASLPPDAFGDDLKKLFCRTFTGDPKAIPSVGDYVLALEDIVEGGLRTCPACGFDHPSGKASCPACGEGAARGTSLVRRSPFKLIALAALAYALCACSPDAAAFVGHDVPAFAGAVLETVLDVARDALGDAADLVDSLVAPLVNGTTA